MMPILQGSGKDTGDPGRIFPGAHSNLQNLSKFSKVRTLQVLHGSPPDGLPSPHMDGCTHMPQGRKGPLPGGFLVFSGVSGASLAETMVTLLQKIHEISPTGSSDLV